MVCSIIYAGIFLIIAIRLLFSDFFLFDIYLIPVCIGAIRILVALIPRVNHKQEDDLIFSENCFIENTKKIATSMQSLYPKSIYVIYDANACAFSYKGEEVIALGFPLTILMNKSELSFVIGHELAHHFYGDVRYGKNMKKVESTFMKLMITLNNPYLFVLAWPYRFIAKILFKEIKKLSRQAEYNADRHSANIIGKQPTISALKKIAISRYSWHLYLSLWIRILSEYQIYVDIVENYRLFITTLDIDTNSLEFSREPAGEYDSHPTLYERIMEVENKCTDDTDGIEIDEYHIDSIKLSKHFWNRYTCGKFEDLNSPIIKDSKKAMEELAIKMASEYKDIFESYTYADASAIMTMYPQVSYNLYQKTHEDEFEFEVDMITRILCAIIYLKIKPENWRIGPSFTPELIVEDQVIDLYSIIIDSFNFKSANFNEMLKTLNIDGHDLISELSLTEHDYGTLFV